MELQEDPSFEYPTPVAPFFDGSCTDRDPSICLQVMRFLIWSHEDGGFFCFFRLCLEYCCFLGSEGSGKKVKSAIKEQTGKIEGK